MVQILIQGLMTKRKTSWTVPLMAIILVLLILNCQETITEDSSPGLYLPKGFEATVVIDSLRGHARQLAVNDNGDIYVKLKHADGIFGNTALRDTNGDGKADLIQSFGEDTHDGPLGAGMTIWKGYLYFSSQRIVYRIKLETDQLIPEGKLDTILIDTFGNGFREHIAKPIVFGPDERMYIPFGAPSNACQEPKRTPGAPGLDPCPQLENYAGVWHFDPHQLYQQQSDGIHYASGIRSLVCMDWHYQGFQSVCRNARAR